MKRSLVKLLGLSLGLVGSAAFAQTTSDLMPPLPTRSPGGGGYYYPGMPVPAPAASAGNNTAGGTVTKSGDTGRKGYDIYDTSSVFGGGVDSAQHVEADQIPETHVVRKGDTLWEIAGLYFKNNWSWPKLWALNPSITNPHWIYPGDIIRIMKESAEPAAATPVSINTPPDRKRPVRTEGVFLRQTGFIEPDELKSAGTIVGSKEEKILLSSGDEAYVEMHKDRPLRVGERYTAYRIIEEVKHPVTGKSMGMLVQILGDADVKSITDGKMARVKLIETTDPIERQYKVGPLRRQFKVVEPVQNSKDLIGVVLCQLRPLALVAQQQIAFVDLGKADGVVVGNRLFVTRRGDGYAVLLGTRPIDDKKYPREIVAELLVVDTRDHVSTTLVTKSYVDSRIGDRVESRKGY